MCVCTCVFCELTDTFPSVTPGMFCLIFYPFLSTFYKTKSLEGSYQRFCLEDDTTYFRIHSKRIIRMRKSSPSSNKHTSLYPMQSIPEGQLSFGGFYVHQSSRDFLCVTCTLTAGRDAKPFHSPSPVMKASVCFFSSFSLKGQWVVNSCCAASSDSSSQYPALLWLFKCLQRCLGWLNRIQISEAISQSVIQCFVHSQTHTLIHKLPNSYTHTYFLDLGPDLISGLQTQYFL